MTILWLSQFYAGPSTQRYGFITKSVHVSIVVGKLPLGPFIILVFVVFRCQYNSTNALYSFIYQLRTQFNRP